MVTYSVSFGLKGLYDPDDYPDCPEKDCPDWPYVTKSSEDERSITDLWHASVNGRGDFLQANNAQQLAYGLVALIQDVQKRGGSGASVAVNSHELKQGTKMYQGTYNSAGWTGDVKAYAVNIDGVVDYENPIWSAAKVLDERVVNSGHADRDIYTMGTSGGVEFTFANIGSLTDDQKNSLGVDDTARENLMNFIRGIFPKMKIIMADCGHGSPGWGILFTRNRNL
jgi:type IV pilus assembly protein PilY1